MKKIEAGNKMALLDISEVTPEQGQILAETLAKVIVSSGQYANGAYLTGPHLIMFGEEMIYMNIANQDLQKNASKPANDYSNLVAYNTFCQKILGHALLRFNVVGSRVTCNPPPVNTDQDYLALVVGDPYQAMTEAGFTQDGSPEFYTGNDKGGFRSWRRGNVNIITTEDSVFYDKFMKATYLAKRLNLLDKADRIALFQVILYDVAVECLEPESYPA